MELSWASSASTASAPRTSGDLRLFCRGHQGHVDLLYTDLSLNNSTVQFATCSLCQVRTSKALSGHVVHFQILVSRVLGAVVPFRMSQGRKHPAARGQAPFERNCARVESSKASFPKRGVLEIGLAAVCAKYKHAEKKETQNTGTMSRHV